MSLLTKDVKGPARGSWRMLVTSKQVEELLSTDKMPLTFEGSAHERAATWRSKKYIQAVGWLYMPRTGMQGRVTLQPAGQRRKVFFLPPLVSSLTTRTIF